MKVGNLVRIKQSQLGIEKGSIALIISAAEVNQTIFWVKLIGPERRKRKIHKSSLELVRVEDWRQSRKKSF